MKFGFLMKLSISIGSFTSFYFNYLTNERSKLLFFGMSIGALFGSFNLLLTDRFFLSIVSKFVFFCELYNLFEMFHRFVCGLNLFIILYAKDWFSQEELTCEANFNWLRGFIDKILPWFKLKLYSWYFHVFFIDFIEDLYHLQRGLNENVRLFDRFFTGSFIPEDSFMRLNSFEKLLTEVINWSNYLLEEFHWLKYYSFSTSLRWDKTFSSYSLFLQVFGLNF